jgi:hypothetical protein
MSKYHQYPEFSDHVVARYQKTLPCKLSGIRLNPHNPTERVDFILASREDNFHDGQLTFDPDTDVIELYSEQEKRMFEALNKKSFQAGKLAPYTDTPQPIETKHALTEEQIKALSTYGNKTQFKAKLDEFESWVPVSRILAYLNEDSPEWRRKLLLERMNELNPQ